MASDKGVDSQEVGTQSNQLAVLLHYLPVKLVVVVVSRRVGRNQYSLVLPFGGSSSWDSFAVLILVQRACSLLLHRNCNLDHALVS